MLNAFTVDVEDYFQVSAFEQHVRRDAWDTFEHRVVDNTHRMLELLAKHEVRATFFVLGWVARKFPNLVREICQGGHELASHGYWHRLVYTMTPDEFRSDLRDSKHALEDAAGVCVVAYRAASFSITSRSLWALDILAEQGFQLDSSIFPIRHDRYGIPGAQRFPHIIQTQNGALRQFPPTVLPIGRWNLPVAGGGYFRLYPLRLTMAALQRVNRVWNQPFVFYVHPWEIDPQQPRLRAASWPSRARHYVNLRATERKLDQLLGKFRFGSLSSAFPVHNADNACPA